MSYKDIHKFDFEIVVDTIPLHFSNGDDDNRLYVNTEIGPDNVEVCSALKEFLIAYLKTEGYKISQYGNMTETNGGFNFRPQHFDDTYNDIVHPSLYMPEFKRIMEEIKAYAEEINPDTQKPYGLGRAIEHQYGELPDVPTEYVPTLTEVSERNAQILTPAQYKNAVSFGLFESSHSLKDKAEVVQKIMAGIESAFDEAEAQLRPVKEQAIRDVIRDEIHKKLEADNVPDAKNVEKAIMEEIYQQIRTEKGSIYARE